MGTAAVTPQYDVSPPDSQYDVSPPDDKAVTATRPGLLSRAWTALNTPIGQHSDTYNKETEQLNRAQNFAQTEEGRKAFTEHPILTGIKSVLAGMERDAADMVTPAFLATALAPAATSAVKAAAPVLAASKPAVVAGKTAALAVPAAFGAQGAKQVYQGVTDPNMTVEDRARAVLGGAAGVTGAGAGLGYETQEPVRNALLKAGRRITGADTAVKEAVGKAAEKQAADTAAMTETNKALEDQRARRRQVEQNVQDKTQALEQQTNQIKASAKAKNDANWETVREKVGNEPVDLGEVSSTIKAQEAKMDPNSQAIFRQILKEGSAPEELDQIRNEVMAKSKGIPSGVPYESLSPELKSVVDDVVQRQAAIEGIDPDSNSNVPFTRLQGWYTELGQKQFAGGQIPGNIYKAIDTVRKAVRKTMDDTAEAHGATDDLDAARVSNTQYQDAFGRQRAKRLSAADENLKKTNPEEFARKQAQAKIDKVAVHDPTYPDAVQQAVDAHETLKQFPSEKAIATKVQAPPDEPTVDLQKVSQNEIEKKAKNWGSFNGRDVGIFASSMLAQPILHMLGHAGAGETIGIAAGAFMGGKMLASKLATTPSVIEFLSRPSASDLELISKIPGADKVKVINGFTDAAVEAAKSGKPLKIAPQTALLLGPENVRKILAASAEVSQPKSPKSRKDLLESKP